MPTMVLSLNSPEDLILPNCTNAQKANAFTMLSLQEKYGYEEAERKALSKGFSKTFVNSCKYILIRNPKLQNLLPNMLNEVLDYRPIQYVLHEKYVRTGIDIRDVVLYIDYYGKEAIIDAASKVPP